MSFYSFQLFEIMKRLEDIQTEMWITPLKTTSTAVYSYSRHSYIWVNGVQIIIFNFLVELSFDPCRHNDNFGCKQEGAPDGNTLWNLLTKLHNSGKIYTSGVHSFRICSLLFYISSFLFIAIKKCTAIKIFVIQKQNNKTSQKKAVHVVYILLFP